MRYYADLVAVGEVVEVEVVQGDDGVVAWFGIGCAGSRAQINTSMVPGDIPKLPRKEENSGVLYFAADRVSEVRRHYWMSEISNAGYHNLLWQVIICGVPWRGWEGQGEKGVG